MVIHLTKYFGLKIEKTKDADNNAGIHFFAWYPKSRTRLKYASAWLPLFHKA